MKQSNRSEALLEVIRQCLYQYDQTHNKTILGDRTQYVGLSDLAGYLECPRRVVAMKTFPTETTLEEELVLQRGHWFEEGIGQSLSSMGLNLMSQLEINLTQKSAPIKTHLDFALVWKEPAVRILEIKSVSKIPDSPYMSHEFQVKGQTSLLHAYWNAPVFSLTDSMGQIQHERLTFPELCIKRFGLELPTNPDSVSVEGWLLYLSMTGAGAFGPFLNDESVLREIDENGSRLWELSQGVHSEALTLNDIPYAQGFHPLCQYCRFNADCPKFKDVKIQSDLEATISHLDNLKESRSNLDYEIKELESTLKQVYQLSAAKGWINTGSHRFKVTEMAGRRMLDKELLKSALETVFIEAHIENVDIDSLLCGCEKEGASSTRLTIHHVQ